MTVRHGFALALLASLCLAPMSWAQAPGSAPAMSAAAPKPLPVELLLFEFENEDGKVSSFQVANGGSVNISDRERGLYYSLFASRDEKGEVSVRLVQYAEGSRETTLTEETFGVEKGAGLQASLIAPFRVAFVGERMQLAKVVSQPSNYIECCVSCGGWTICCGVAMLNRLQGICCTIDHCGWLCTVCEFSETA